MHYARLIACRQRFILLKLPVVAIICCLLASGISAQQNTPPPDVGGDHQKGQQGEQPPQELPKEDVPDTAKLIYFYSDNPTQRFLYSDTTLGNYLDKITPARKRPLEYFTLGVPGTAAYPAFYETGFHKGVDAGLHSFDLYRVESARLRYFPGLQRAFSEFAFAVNDQNDGALTAKFARSFKDGFNFTFEYNRIFNYNAQQKQVQGYNYQIPRNRTIALAGGLWYHAPNEKYDGYLTFSSNVFTPFDYGGISDDAIFHSREGIDTSRVAPNVPVNINGTAQARYDTKEYSYLQYYRLNKKDTLKTLHKERDYLISLQTTLNTSSYKYYDKHTTTSNPDTLWNSNDYAFYGKLLTDIRGLRYFLQTRTFENTVRVSTSSGDAGRDSLRRLAVKTNDWFELGLTQQLVSVRQEPLSFTKNNLIAFGKWNFTPSENIKAETYAHLTLLGANVGDYRLSGDAFLQVKNLGSLKLSAVNQLYEPTLLQKQSFVSQQQVWNNHFNKTLETSLSGSLFIDRTQTAVTGSYKLLNNYIYFDTLAAPQQSGAAISILQLVAQQNFHLGVFHLDNTVGVQKITGDVLPLPALYSQNSLYFEKKIFKRVMLLRIGLDARYHDSWYAYNYMPLTGQFFLQRKAQVPAYPLTDFFLSFKVQGFRFFVTIENIYPYLSKAATSINYDVYHYPTPDKLFRFGFNWKLSN